MTGRTGPLTIELCHLLLVLTRRIAKKAADKFFTIVGDYLRLITRLISPILRSLNVLNIIYTSLILFGIETVLHDQYEYTTKLI
jgi:hypothetical protein